MTIKRITLSELSAHVEKSPNHIGYAFKCVKEMTVTEYINLQKVKEIKRCMQENGTSFKAACAAIGLCDDTYGYKIFKKYTGVTPKEYKTIKTINKRCCAK